MSRTIEQVLADRPEELQALRRFRDILSAQFGSRLERVSLFGSHARNDEREGSDVDVLVLLRHATARDLHEAAALAGDVATEFGIWLSPTNHPSERFEQLLAIEQPFARSVVRDAVSV